MKANLAYLVKANEVMGREPEAWGGPVIVISGNHTEPDWVDFYPERGPHHAPLFTLTLISRVLFRHADLSFIVQGYDQSWPPHKFYSLLLTQQTEKEWLKGEEE
jgi:hypothetical protein